jgi:L-ascorbate metabolism protein UlaG (beta-lactamase superfamily)
MPRSTCSLTYAGHSAVLIDDNNYVVAIDPWLEGNPRCPAALKSPPKIDLIVLTHGHSDHASEAAALARKHKAQLAATWELAMLMAEEGVDSAQLVPMNKGGTCAVGPLKVSLTHALHSSSYDSATGSRYAGEACGVLLHTSAGIIYHAGDTCLFSDMQLIAEQYPLELALLPIGDRFTMGPQEAAKAASWLKAKVVTPIHYATFDLLTGSSQEFQSCCQKIGQECKVLNPGESLALS